MREELEDGGAEHGRSFVTVKHRARAFIEEASHSSLRARNESTSAHSGKRVSSEAGKK